MNHFDNYTVLNLLKLLKKKYNTTIPGFLTEDFNYITNQILYKDEFSVSKELEKIKKIKEDAEKMIADIENMEDEKIKRKLISIFVNDDVEIIQLFNECKYVYKSLDIKLNKIADTIREKYKTYIKKNVEHLTDEKVYYIYVNNEEVYVDIYMMLDLIKIRMGHNYRNGNLEFLTDIHITFSMPPYWKADLDIKYDYCQDESIIKKIKGELLNECNKITEGMVYDYPISIVLCDDLLEGRTVTVV